MSRPKLELHQFGIKQIMVLTCMVALLCVPVGAFLRRLPADKQLKAYVGLLLMFVVVVVAVANVFRRRFLAEQVAGDVLLQLSSQSTPIYHILNVSSCVFLLAMVGMLLVNYVYSYMPLRLFAGGGYQFIYPLSLWVGASASYLVTYWWWGIDPTRVEICENGIIQKAVNVTLWSNFHGYRWGRVIHNELFLLTDGDFMQIIVPASMKEEVIKNLPPQLCEKDGWTWPA